MRKEMCFLDVQLGSCRVLLIWLASHNLFGERSTGIVAIHSSHFVIPTAVVVDAGAGDFHNWDHWTRMLDALERFLSCLANRSDGVRSRCCWQWGFRGKPPASDWSASSESTALRTPVTGLSYEAAPMASDRVEDDGVQVVKAHLKLQDRQWGDFEWLARLCSMLFCAREGFYRWDFVWMHRKYN